MAVKVVALVSVNEDEPMALAHYFRVTTPLLEDVGARIVQRFNVNEVVVGHRPAKSLIVVEYPDKQAVERVFQSAEYRAVTAIRDRAFSEYSISVVADAEAVEKPLIEA